MSSQAYTPGYSDNAVAFMSRRTLDSHAAFLKPYLHRGIKVLDCGSGPGTITVGIAKAIAPGKVWALDCEPQNLQLVRQRAEEEQLNIECVESGVNHLPFEDGTFDAVFSHALIEHLKSPLETLRELRRVVKEKGIIALRSPDWGGFVLEPWNVQVAHAIDSYIKLQVANGGDVYAGRKLAGYLRKLEFERIEISASYEVYPSATEIAEYLALQLEAKGESDSAHSLRAWSVHPNAMFAQAWFEVVAVKPIPPEK